jgi:hypothetical protein
MGSGGGDGWVMFQDYTMYVLPSLCIFMSRSREALLPKL